MSILQLKNISLYQNSDFHYTSPRPVLLRRGVARRHETLGAGCDGRRGVRWLIHRAKTPRRTAKSCGPGAATLASIPAGLCGRGNGDNQGRSPGRSRISRKPISRGKIRHKNALYINAMTKLRSHLCRDPCSV